MAKRPPMRECFHVEIVTPKKVALNGLWIGPRLAKRAVIWVHGLGSSMFSKIAIADAIVDKQTAVLVFNNRGHDKVASGSSGKNKRVRHGAAHERFTDCIDDIEGAIRFARKAGAKKLFVAGHSTGSQKATYWAAKSGRGVRGIVLLAPMSDYAAELKDTGKRKISRALKSARSLIRTGRPHELIPENIWKWSLMADAQRFESLYSGSGPEEIFTYWDPKRRPKILQEVRKPTLVLLAERDEYADRPAKPIAAWFSNHVRAPHRVIIVPKVKHSFKGAEKKVASAIHRFMKES